MVDSKDKDSKTTAAEASGPNIRNAMEPASTGAYREFGAFEGEVNHGSNAQFKLQAVHIDPNNATRWNDTIAWFSAADAANKARDKAIKEHGNPLLQFVVVPV